MKENKFQLGSVSNAYASPVCWVRGVLCNFSEPFQEFVLPHKLQIRIFENFNEQLRLWKAKKIVLALIVVVGHCPCGNCRPLHSPHRSLTKITPRLASAGFGLVTLFFPALCAIVEPWSSRAFELFFAAQPFQGSWDLSNSPSTHTGLKNFVSHTCTPQKETCCWCVCACVHHPTFRGVDPSPYAHSSRVATPCRLLRNFKIFARAIPSFTGTFRRLLQSKFARWSFLIFRGLNCMLVR